MVCKLSVAESLEFSLLAEQLRVYWQLRLCGYLVTSTKERSDVQDKVIFLVLKSTLCNVIRPADLNRRLKISSCGLRVAQGDT